MANQIVRYKGKQVYRPIRRFRAVANMARFVYRARKRANEMKGIEKITKAVVNNIRKRKSTNDLSGYSKGRRLNNNKQYKRLVGTASGTTHTTTRMIVRKTPAKQKFLRKLFKTHPEKTKYINRFGFAWMGATNASKCIWYSIAHLKFNNVCKYMQFRVTNPDHSQNTTSSSVSSSLTFSNFPEAYIYIGKCTFNYELYNPTNYIMTVYIYDLICKRDTVYTLDYTTVSSEANNTPEACMHKGILAQTEQNLNSGYTWRVADPTYDISTQAHPTDQNSLGLKPTDFHMFNTFWKVKGIKKIILPPTSSHHHVVVYNPKKKITNASLYFPRQTHSTTWKGGVGGLTQATLFGFQGQVAVENDTTSDSTSAVGTLPGKLVINCVKKINVWQGQPEWSRIVQESDLLKEFSDPTIFSDLQEVTADQT